MKVRLRGHHLVCLRFYDGTGYDGGFREDLRSLVAYARQRGVSVAEGADDLCVRCHYLEEGRCAHTPTAEEEVRGMDRMALMLLGLRPGQIVSWDELGHRIPGFFQRWRSEFCEGCAWKGVCEGRDAYRELCAGSR